jgi:oligopeptide/dipeptide ABC transporter ATP-binding protein
MYAGRIVEQAPVDELFANVHHPYTEALMAASPRPSDTKARALYTITGQPPDLTETFDHCVFAGRCRYVQDDCIRLEPVMAAARHGFACFHPRGEGATPSPPREREALA